MLRPRPCDRHFRFRFFAPAFLAVFFTTLFLVTFLAVARVFAVRFFAAAFFAAFFTTFFLVTLLVAGDFVFLAVLLGVVFFTTFFLVTFFLAALLDFFAAAFFGAVFFAAIFFVGALDAVFLVAFFEADLLLPFALARSPTAAVPLFLTFLGVRGDAFADFFVVGFDFGAGSGATLFGSTSPVPVAVGGRKGRRR